MILLTAALLFLIIPNTKAAVQVFAKDDYVSIGSLHRMEAHARAQGHLVFADGASGWSIYTMYLGGGFEYDPPSDGTKIVVKLYITAHYKLTYYPFGSPAYAEHYEWWGPPPLDLIQWNGLMNYGASTPGTVTWYAEIGGEYKGFSMSFGYSYTPNAFSGWGTGSSESDIYRYYGYFKSQYNTNDHSFQALLKFDVSNQLANDYYYGLYENVYSYPYGYTITWITGIQIKLKWYYYYRFFWTYWHFHTYTGDLHDEPLDLSEILLYPGAVEI